MKAKQIAAALLTGGNAIAQNRYEPSPEVMESREQFSADRFGIFIHWGIYSICLLYTSPSPRD